MRRFFLATLGRAHSSQLTPRAGCKVPRGEKDIQLVKSKPLPQKKDIINTLRRTAGREKGLGHLANENAFTVTWWHFQSRVLWDGGP